MSGLQRTVMYMGFALIVLTAINATLILWVVQTTAEQTQQVCTEHKKPATSPE